MKKIYTAPLLTVCRITPCTMLNASGPSSSTGYITDDWSPDDLPDGWGILEVKPDQKGTPD